MKEEIIYIYLFCEIYIVSIKKIQIYIYTYIGIEDGVRTRSKAESQPYEWTSMPVLVKIFKVIINELANDIEIINATQDTEVSNTRLCFFLVLVLLFFILFFYFQFYFIKMKT